MRVLNQKYLKKTGIDIFTACGASDEEAALVASELVEASLMGLDSHGVMRYAQYVEEVLENKIKPGSPIQIIKESPSTAIVDCGLNFGQVSATRLTEIAYEKAKLSNIVCVVSRKCNHIGRLGSFTQKLAEKNLLCFAVASGGGHTQVAPWGGIEGRLSPNPMSYGVPMNGNPMVLDMSTSMIAEGKVRILMQQGNPVPEGCIQDAAGKPTTNPKDFYGPPKGTILPFGLKLGYKGFGLALMVEIFGRILAGVSIDEDGSYVNGLCIIAVNLEAFCGLELTKKLMDELNSFIKAAALAPGHDEIYLPGELDFKTKEKRLREGIPVADETWLSIKEAAKKVDIII